MSAAAAPSTAPKSKPRERTWAPRFWIGMEYFATLQLLAENRCAVHAFQWHTIPVLLINNFFNNFLMRLWQEAQYGRKADKLQIQPPLFVIGHWRTGTTHLHELLSLDERFASPTTFECFSPTNFLIVEEAYTRLLSFLLPSKRPMDNMKMGWDRPQEDEFALTLLGARSPYRTLAFPNHGPVDTEYLDLAHLPPQAVRAWQKTLHRFLQRVALKNANRRLVLKSPTHTARLRVLVQLYPQAQFVHIVRNPYEVFPSTVNLWKSLYRTHGLQVPNFEGLEEFVFATFSRMMDRLAADRALIPEANFHQVRYEDLVREPEAEMRRIYERLNLGGFDRFLPQLQAYLATLKGYETNKYEMTPEMRAAITRRWGPIIARLGYPVDDA